MNNSTLYQTMVLIRKFEERALAEFSTGKLVGTTHAYIGQEANAAGIFPHLDEGDIVWSNHRCHGHFIAYGGPADRLAAELMGKATGLVGGRGGSQHIHWKNFYSNGIQGGIVPVAAGMAFVQKLDKTGKIALVFIGDGTLGEGVVYETLNLASLWNLPILIVVEDNGYAQTTPKEIAVAGSMTARFEAFGVMAFEITTSDVLEISDIAQRAIGYVRAQVAPAVLVVHTHRFSAHSKGDDTRDKNLVKQLKDKFDPITIHGSRLSAEEKTRIDMEVNNRIDLAFNAASSAPFPMLSSVDEVR